MEKAKGYDGKYEIVIGEKVYYMDYIEELDALKLLLTYKIEKEKIGIKKMYDKMEECPEKADIYKGGVRFFEVGIEEAMEKIEEIENVKQHWDEITQDEEKKGE